MAPHRRVIKSKTFPCRNILICEINASWKLRGKVFLRRESNWISWSEEMFFHFLPGHHTISFLGYKCLWQGKIYCCSRCSVYPSQSQLQIFPKVIKVFFRWISRMYFEVVKKFKFILPFACICSLKDLNWRQMWLKQKGGT